MNRFSSFVFSALIIFGLTAVSCSDPCDKLDCGAFGNCIEGDDDPICVCENGYEKDSADLCEVRATTKFVGTWEVEAVCVEQNTFRRDTSRYSVTIFEEAESISIFQIRMDGLGNLPECPSGGFIDPVPLSVSFARVQIQPLTFCPDPENNFSGYEFATSTGSLDVLTDEFELTYRVKWTSEDPTSGELVTQDWLCEALLTR
ncbi:MAG: hypothetical protein AAF399_23690 [Bacteroidota bacterium]